MRILVLGYGFLGKFIVKEIVSHGHEVTVYDRNKQDKVNYRYNYIQGDLLNLKLLNTVLQGQDVIIHCAGISGIEQVQNKHFTEYKESFDYLRENGRLPAFIDTDSDKSVEQKIIDLANFFYNHK